MQLSDDIGQLTYKVWYFAVAEVRRGSARQPDQRQAPAGADSVREGRARPAPGSIPSCSRIPLPTVQQWMAANAELAVYRFALEDLYRQQEHVLDEKGEHLLSLVEPLLVGAERRLRGALDRRRQAPDDHAVDRPRGHAHLRAVPRDPGDQPQPERSRRGVRRPTTSCSRPTSTPTRRSTTACCSATGSTRSRAATGRRSTRRCTATTFRPRSSRT